MSQPTTPVSPETLLLHADFVRGLARGLVRDVHVADDLAQDTLLRALERPPRSVASLRAWLFSVTRNFARQRQRGSARRRVHETGAARAASDAESEPSASDVLEREAVRTDVVRAVLALPELQRRAVLLRYYAGCAPREIARRLGLPPETVRTQLKRGRGRIRAALEQEHGRDQWLGALLPLAAASKTAKSSLVTPLLASVGFKLSAAVVLVGGLAWWSLRAPSERPSPGPIAQPAPSQARQREVHAEELTATMPPVRTPVRASTQATEAAPAPVPALPSPEVAPEPMPPRARLAVRATILDTGEDLVGFTAQLRRLEQNRSYRQTSTTGALLEMDVKLTPGREYEDFELVVEHASLGRAEERVRLFPDRLLETTLTFHTGRILTGVVVDELERPVPGALVFLGIQENLRGDEPFKPYEPRRVKNGVRSDELGHYQLAGKGPWVSVWHPELSPSTVSSEHATRIVLRPRASLAGVLYDASGSPLAGERLVMDRVREATTDEQGHFRFEALEAGLRGLQLADGRMLAVDVEPGENPTIELTQGLPLVTIELLKDGQPLGAGQEDAAIAIGGGRVQSLLFGTARDGRIELEHVQPGSYHVLTRSGLIARTEIDGDHATGEVGRSSLAVHATPGRSLFVAPADANELVWLMANRVAARKVPVDGELVFTPLPAGNYIVGSEGMGELGRVVVSGDAAEITIP